MGFSEWLPSMIWYTVEFMCYISIIAYTLFTFGILKPIKFKSDVVPATFNQTWKDANSFLNTASSIATKVKKAIDGDKNGENNNDSE